jgi:hypothetical protein
MYIISFNNRPKSDEVIGVVGINRWDQVHFIIDPRFQSEGYASEALSAFLVELFKLQPKRLSIGTMVGQDNTANIKVLEKVGFVPNSPKKTVSVPTTAEPTEAEELKALQGLGYKHVAGEAMEFFFLYLNPNRS